MGSSHPNQYIGNERQPTHMEPHLDSNHSKVLVFEETEPSPRDIGRQGTYEVWFVILPRGQHLLLRKDHSPMQDSVSNGRYLTSLD